MILVFMIGLGLYLAKLWRDDCADHVAGRENRAPLPGATPASSRACMLGAIGALLILAGETAAEIGLGVSDEQSAMTVLFGLYTLAAAMIEELIFRGFLVVEGHGPRGEWLGAIAASVAFTLLHPFLWEWEDKGFQLTLDLHGAVSSTAVFASSLWFYAIRFAKWNPTRSLLPCIVAHVTKNAGVFAVKGVQGFVSGWW